MLQIYTDGAYKSSIDQGGIGIVWIKDDKVFKKYSKGFKHTTNNRMELIAMLCAFKSIKTSMEEVEFISDSQYVLGCLTMGVLAMKVHIRHFKALLRTSIVE